MWERAPKDMQPPAYPVNAFRGGATGVVYLLLKIGRAGKVEDVVAEQVNLTALVPESKPRTLAAGVCRCVHEQGASLGVSSANRGP